MSSSATDNSKQFSFGPWKINGNEVFLESALSFAFVNLRPLVPGHVLVSPIRTASRFSDLNTEEVMDLWATAHKVGKQLEPHYGADSMTYAIQDGPAAGQTVPHVHIHILPRKLGDFERNDEVYDAIEENEKAIEDAVKGDRKGEKLDLDVDRKDRTPEEMAAEASALRELLAPAA